MCVYARPRVRAYVSSYAVITTRPKWSPPTGAACLGCPLRSACSTNLPSGCIANQQYTRSFKVATQCATQQGARLLAALGVGRKKGREERARASWCVRARDHQTFPPERGRHGHHNKPIFPPARPINAAKRGYSTYSMTYGVQRGSHRWGGRKCTDLFIQSCRPRGGRGGKGATCKGRAEAAAQVAHGRKGLAV